ncbi:MAG: dephospho-CoA kinase, partial [Flavobacteriales bacterium]
MEIILDKGNKKYFSVVKVIGITGGIGSGKSTIARVFHSFGIPVFDSDASAKKMYIRYPEVVKMIEKELSIKIQQASGLEFHRLA